MWGVLRHKSEEKGGAMSLCYTCVAGRKEVFKIISFFSLRNLWTAPHCMTQLLQPLDYTVTVTWLLKAIFTLIALYCLRSHLFNLIQLVCEESGFYEHFFLYSFARRASHYDVFIKEKWFICIAFCIAMHLN